VWDFIFGRVSLNDPSPDGEGMKSNGITFHPNEARETVGSSPTLNKKPTDSSP